MLAQLSPCGFVLVRIRNPTITNPIPVAIIIFPLFEITGIVAVG